MAGILLVVHNELGSCLVDCVRHVLGDIPHNLRILPVFAMDDPQRKLAEGRALVKQLDKGNGVLILSDIYGATPSNIARQLCQKEQLMGVAGVNLPMLLRVVCYPNKPMLELAKIAFEGGRESIVYMNTED